MPISKTHAKKSPSQNPVAFYEGKQAGGALPIGKPEKVGDKISSPACREQIYGRKSLK